MVNCVKNFFLGRKINILDLWAIYVAGQIVEYGFNVVIACLFLFLWVPASRWIAPIK